MLLLLLGTTMVEAQVLQSGGGNVSFFTATPIEDISASNIEIVSTIEVKSGCVYFDVPVKSFSFEHEMMKWQFDKYFLDTDDYPKAEFFGKLSGFNINSVGEQSVTATGNLNIHGVSRPIKASGKMSVENGEVTLKAVFKIDIEHYDIDSPFFFFHPLADDVDIMVNMKYVITGS